MAYDINRNNLTPDFSNREKPSPAPAEQKAGDGGKSGVRPLFGHRFGILDYAVTAVCIGCTAGIMLLGDQRIRWVLAALMVLMLFSPSVIQRIVLRHRFGLASIMRAFRKMGISPEIRGNELVWEANGAKNIVRLVKGCQLQICREYASEPELMPKFTTAASATMTQVFSAKVGAYAENEQTLNIYFATEMLCSSVKEFGKIYSASVGILDEAESRQKANLMRLMDEEKAVEKKPRKIGFRMD